MKLVPGFLSKAVSKATSFRCGVENFEMFGQLMLSFRPLMHQLPVVGGLQATTLPSPPPSPLQSASQSVLHARTPLGGTPALLDLIPSRKFFIVEERSPREISKRWPQSI